MVATIVVNESNVITTDGLNNKLAYSFPNSVSFPSHEIAIQNISMYYSWQNVNSTTLANNVFYYSWPVANQGVSGTNYPLTSPAQSGYSMFQVVIPSGLYELADINSFLHFVMIQNGHYAIVTNTGSYVYFAEFIINSSAYSIQLNTYPVPTTAGTGATSLTGLGMTAGVALGTVASGYPNPPGYGTVTTYVNPSVSMFNNVNTNIPTSNFYKLIGYDKSYYSPFNLSANFSALSTSSPQIQPNPILYIAISNIENKYANPNTIIGTIAPTVAFGELITLTPPQFAFNRLLSGTYNGLRISLLGANYSPIAILDPNITITLVIRDTKEAKDMIKNAITGDK